MGGGDCRKPYPTVAEAQHYKGRLLTRSERFTEVPLAAKQARRPLISGQIIIMVVDCLSCTGRCRSENVPSNGNDGGLGLDRCDYFIGDFRPCCGGIICYR